MHIAPKADSMPNLVKKTSQPRPEAPMTGFGAVFWKSGAILAQFDQLCQWFDAMR